MREDSLTDMYGAAVQHSQTRGTDIGELLGKQEKTAQQNMGGGHLSVKSDPCPLFCLAI